MKILITVDPELPIPPILYGGVERIVNGLIKEFTLSGNEILLIANKNSKKGSYKLIKWPVSSSRNLVGYLLNSIVLLYCCIRYKPDIVHSFSRLLYLYPLLLLTRTPVIMSYGRFIDLNSVKFTKKLAGNQIHFTACARHMLNHIHDKTNWHIIYNFVDISLYELARKPKNDYLIFLGRIEDIKGTKEAIEVALRLNYKLIIAGNINDDQKEYFEEFIQPNLSNPLIYYVGPVNDSQKKELLQNAKATILPFKLQTEAFGLTTIESMACGTPVISFNIAAVHEIIINGKTGFICNSIEEMVECVQLVDSLDRQFIRNYVEEKFGLKKIATEYLTLLSKSVNNG
ncbi:MAG: glycosyltransferase [Bacteroidia bacterium]|nr:glycosyltransferase [Bacteroidia bacterium]